MTLLTLPEGKKILVLSSFLFVFLNRANSKNVVAPISRVQDLLLLRSSRQTHLCVCDVLIVECFGVFDRTKTFKFLSLVRDQLIRTQDKSLDLKLHLFQTWHSSN